MADNSKTEGGGTGQLAERSRQGEAQGEQTINEEVPRTAFGNLHAPRQKSNAGSEGDKKRSRNILKLKQHHPPTTGTTNTTKATQGSNHRSNIDKPKQLREVLGSSGKS